MRLKSKPANFDFLGAAHQGYRSVWDNRNALLRLAALPFFVKTGCIAAILFLGFEDQILRHGLVMLPSYFAEGFFIAYVIRVVHAGGSLGDDVKQAQSYFNDIVAAMIVFVLIQLTLAFVLGYTLSTMPAELMDGTVADGDSNAEAALASADANALQGFFMAISVFAFMLWAFRFAWLHIPIAMGIPLSRFLVRIQSFSSSIPMLGCWLACFMPLVFVMLLVSRVVMSVIPDLEGQNAMLPMLIVGSIQGAFEIAINLVAAIAMSYGFKSLMEKK